MIANRWVRTAAAASLCVPLLAACQQGGGMDRTTAGTVGGGAVGAVLGGIAGGAIGGNRTGAVIGALVGAVAGGLLGNTIGARLDAQDRERAAYSTREALSKPVGTRTTWRSAENSNISGHSTVISARGNCRVVRQYANISGSAAQEDVRFCQDGSGNWVAS